MRVLMIIFGIFMVIGGINCIATPVETFAAFGYLVGVLVIVTGISAILDYLSGRESRSIWRLISGICGVILGCLMIGNAYGQFATVMMMTFFIAAWMLARGFDDIRNALILKSMNDNVSESNRNGFWIVILIIGICTVILGIVCAVDPIISIISAGMLMGISILFAGIQALTFGIMFK